MAVPGEICRLLANNIAACLVLLTCGSIPVSRQYAMYCSIPSVEICEQPECMRRILKADESQRLPIASVEYETGGRSIGRLGFNGDSKCAQYWSLQFEMNNVAL